LLSFPVVWDRKRLLSSIILERVENDDVTSQAAASGGRPTRRYTFEELVAPIIEEHGKLFPPKDRSFVMIAGHVQLLFRSVLHLGKRNNLRIFFLQAAIPYCVSSTRYTLGKSENNFEATSG
jgi:hypothetical protein